MAVITSQWWRRLVNAYEVKAGMVSLWCVCSVKLCDPCLSASEVSYDVALYKSLYIYLLPFTRSVVVRH